MKKDENRWRRYLRAIGLGGPTAAATITTWPVPDYKEYYSIGGNVWRPPPPPPMPGPGGVVHATDPFSRVGTMCGEKGSADTVNSKWINCSCIACLEKEPDNPWVKRRMAEVKAAGPRVDASRYPHRCPRCGKAAYVGAYSLDCTGGCR